MNMERRAFDDLDRIIFRPTLERLLKTLDKPASNAVIGDSKPLSFAAFHKYHDHLESLKSKSEKHPSVLTHLAPSPCSDEESMTKFLADVKHLLEPEGFIYGFLDYPSPSKPIATAYAKYGFEKKLPSPLAPFDYITYMNQIHEVKSLHLGEVEYQSVFLNAGFSSLELFGPYANEDEIKKWPRSYWDLLLEAPPFMAYYATSSLGHPI